MRAVAKIRFKWATGVSVAEDHLVATTMAITPTGPQEIETLELPLPEEGLADGLRELQEQLTLRGPITVGVDTAQVSYLTTEKRKNPDDEEDDASSPGTGEAARFASDSTPVKLPSGDFIATASCDAQLAKQTLAGLDGTAVSRLRLTASSLALHRLATIQTPGPKKWRTVVRVFRGESSSLAVLSYGRVPLAQRLFDNSTTAEIDGLLVAVSGLLVYAHSSLSLSRVDGVLVHDGDRGDEFASRCEDALDIPVRSVAEITLNSRSVAHALAISGLRPVPCDVDLLRSLRPPPGLRENFPWATAVGLIVVLGGSLWALRSEAQALEGQIAKLKRQATADAKFAGSNIGEVGLKYDSVLKEVDVAHAFIVNRVYWTDIVKEIDRCVPEGVVLTVIKGHDSLSIPNRLTKQQKRKSKKYLTAKKGSKVKVQKDLVVGGAVRISSAEGTVPEIPALLAALQSSEMIRREFPTVRGADLEVREKKTEEVRGMIAEFVVRCDLGSGKK